MKPALELVCNKIIGLEYGKFKTNMNIINTHAKVLAKWKSKAKDARKQFAKRYPEYTKNIHKNFKKKGYVYLGNISSTVEFKRLITKINSELGEVEEAYGIETLQKLYLNQKLERNEKRLQRHCKTKIKVNGFPSITEDAGLYVPSEILKRVYCAEGISYYCGSLIAWQQVNLPHIPWIHKDGYTPIGYKLFILCERTDESNGAMKVYSKLQSMILSLFRNRKHLDFTEKQIGPLLGIKPFRLSGNKGDIFLVDPNRCYHSEGELEIGKTRLMAQVMVWPYYYKKSIQTYIPKPKPK